MTLWQPYATLVAVRAKGNETRSWATYYRGPLAIHAAKRYPPDLRALAGTEPFRSALAGVAPEDYLGMVVVVVELVDCRLITPDNIPPEPERSFGDYRPGRYMWIQRNVRRLVEPVAARGKQGLWVWDMPKDIQFGKEVDPNHESDN